MANYCEFGRWLSNPPPGEEIVITGMFGRLPESNNISEFGDNLLNKKNLVTGDDRRWQLDHPEIPQRNAKIYDLDKLDAVFFGLHYRQSNIMDPLMRKFLETAIEAIIDAGLNPSELKGTKTGVFIGTSYSDVEAQTLLRLKKPHLFGITGYLRSLLAHRLCYYLKVKGPAFITDTACSSSSNALESAFKAMPQEKCDNAIVGGLNKFTDTSC